MALRKPTFCPATYTNATETTTISRNGAHQAALRRRSVKVFDGAMNVLMMRAPSESAAGWETGDLGKTGAVAIDVSFEVRWNSSRWAAWRQATTRLRFLHAECDAGKLRAYACAGPSVILSVGFQQPFRGTLRQYG